jgi:hypothetical protein
MVYNDYMTIKFSITIGTIVMAAATTITDVYAGGPRHNYDERYEDVPGAPQCWTDGFDDGANNSFDENRDKEFKDLHSRGFDGGKVCNEEAALERSASASVRDDCLKARGEDYEN